MNVVTALLLFGGAFALIFCVSLITGCSETDRGAFDYPDGIYEGASDLYD